MGVQILKKDNFIKKFNNDDLQNSLILKTVKYHNKFRLPDSLSEREKLFCNIVRDADKIDILYLDLGVLNNFEVKNSFSRKVFDSLTNKELVLKSDIKTDGDKLAIGLGFIFDINFKYSIELLKRKDYFNKLIDKYSKNTSNNELKRELLEIGVIIDKYMEDKLC